MLKPLYQIDLMNLFRLLFDPLLVRFKEFFFSLSCSIFIVPLLDLFVCLLVKLLRTLMSGLLVDAAGVLVDAVEVVEVAEVET